MKLKRRRPRLKTTDRWKDSYYVRAYRLALEGMKDGAIAAALGTSRGTFARWKTERRALSLALKQARGGKVVNTQSFGEYVSGRLPAHLKAIWDGVERADQADNPERRIEALLAGQGEGVRKQIFVHAFVSGNFNKAEACRKANVSYGTVRKWMADPVFVDLMDQVHEMKQDFVEGCLMGLVGQGDTTATVFASKTLNRDRGYDSKKTIVHEGVVQHAHFDIAQLPLKLRKEIMEWAEQNGYGEVAGALPEHVPEAEYTIQGAK